MTKDDFETLPTGSRRKLTDQDLEIQGLREDCAMWKERVDKLEQALRIMRLDPDKVVEIVK